MDWPREKLAVSRASPQVSDDAGNTRCATTLTAAGPAMKLAPKISAEPMTAQAAGQTSAGIVPMATSRHTRAKPRPVFRCVSSRPHSARDPDDNPCMDPLDPRASLAYSAPHHDGGRLFRRRQRRHDCPHHAEPLGKRLGTPVVIENVSGAGGTIAGQKVVNAAPDGYSLFMASGSEVSIARLFNPAVKYNGETDFTPIGLVGDVPMVLVASPRSCIKTAPEALLKAQREPGSLSYASSGIGIGIGTVRHVGVSC